MADLPARIKAMQKLHGSSIGGGVSPYHPESSSRSQNQNPNESWKAFDKGSEAGRLMAKLYGGSYKPAINYPAPRSKRTKPVDQPAWRPSNKGNAVVSKFSKAAALSVSAPRFPKRHGGAAYAPVDLVPKRRSEGDCRSMIDDAEMRQSAYRPPNIAAFR